MRLTELFVPETVVIGLPVASREDVLEAIVADLDAKGFIANRELAAKDLVARERVMSTGVGHGVAIPHAYTDGVENLVAAVILTAEKVPFDAPDSQDVDLMFVVLGPKSKRRDHIRVLAKIARMVGHAEFRDDVRRAPDAAAVISALKRFGDR